MAGASSREVLRHLNTLFQCGAAGQLSDAELLEQFVAGRDEAAEAAFAALVERHGVMVLGVCRRVLGNRDEAEDAFQATFLVLARKAAAIARREQLASWLHGVARRAALDARARATRQKAREKRLGAMLPVEPPDQTMASELRIILDEELARLPERHRAAIVLCELEGLSRRDAAVRLGVSEGTLSSRLARAKSRLRDRLTRRGFALSAAALASVLPPGCPRGDITPFTVDSTIRVATLVAAGSSLAGVVSTSVVNSHRRSTESHAAGKVKVRCPGSGYPGRRLDERGRTGTRPLLIGPPTTIGSRQLNGSSTSFWKYWVDRTAARRQPDAPPSLDLAPRVADVTQAPPPALAPLPPVPPPPAVAGTVDSAAVPRRLWNGYALPEPSPKNVAGRLDLLERRLSELERRFSDLERRVETSHTRPGLPPSPTLGPNTPATTPGIPAQPPATSGPRDEPTDVAPGLPSPARSVPSADVAVPEPASLDLAPDSPPSPSSPEGA